MATIEATGTTLGARAALAAMLGVLFNGQRDIYDAAGYAKTLTFGDYYGVYRRQDIAKAVVSAAPAETWRLDPKILDGTNEDDAADDTEFVKAVEELAEAGRPDDFLIDQPGLFQVLHRLDRVVGIGRYGVLLLGINDGKTLDQPLEAGSAKGTADLLYLTVYSEANAQIDKYVDDATNPRYGLPEFYTLATRTSAGVQHKRCHWTRLIHVAEGIDDDDVFGTPRLEAVWNRLVDLLKIMAGSGEAAWKLLDAGQFISTVDGKRLPVDPAQLEALEDQIDEYVHGLRRWLLADGLQANPVSGQMTDPSGLVDVNVTLISAATGIPKRILLGSERGELASTQDESNWAKRIETRQRTQIAPYVIRPVIGRLIYAGVLPKPKSGNFVTKWAPLTEADRVTEANVAKTIADTLATLGFEIEPEAFVEVYLPELPPDALTVPEPEPMPVLPGGENIPQDPANMGDKTAPKSSPGSVPSDDAKAQPGAAQKRTKAPKTNQQVTHEADWAQYP